jgi:hypothetical protein
VDDIIELASLARKVRKHSDAAEACRLLLVVKLSKHMEGSSADDLLTAYQKFCSDEADKT